MKALLVALATIAGTAYVGYSYNATDGESCLVCPMTGEPVFTSTEPEAGPCCAGETDAMLTSIGVKTDSCCAEATGSCCSKGDADTMLTSAMGAECEGSCEKGCCNDKETAVDITKSQEKPAADLTESQEEPAAEVEAEVVVELTEAE